MEVGLGPPVLEWSIAKVRDQDFLRRAYSVMKAWIAAERLNIKLRTVGYVEQLSWEANEVPNRAGIGLSGSAVKDEITQAVLTAVIPYLMVYYNDCRWQRRYDDAELILAVVKMMRDRGVDADPHDRFFKPVETLKRIDSQRDQQRRAQGG